MHAFRLEGGRYELRGNAVETEAQKHQVYRSRRKKKDEGWGNKRETGIAFASTFANLSRAMNAIEICRFLSRTRRGRTATIVPRVRVQNVGREFTILARFSTDGPARWDTILVEDPRRP